MTRCIYICIKPMKEIDDQLLPLPRQTPNDVQLTPDWPLPRSLLYPSAAKYIYQLI